MTAPDTSAPGAILLGPSPTFAARTANIEDGRLVIRTAKRMLGPITTRRYTVEEIRPDRIGCRAFLLTKGDGTDYVAVVGGLPGCDCEAGRKGRKRGSCVHLDALTALVREGRL